ncbi:MAG: DUF2442 domain-containing protein [Verrucomicrobia bacterium]|nr:DUF2442 domain-containing protein [Verrucomicrobiota bacterium]
MKHDFARVTSFEPLGDYTLRVCFADGTSQDIDFRPVLTGEFFEHLRDPNIFSQVRIDPEIGTLVWPNGADFDPDMLHDWDKLKDEFQSQVSAVGTVR